jgi:hypothetical protein
LNIDIAAVNREVVHRSLKEKLAASQGQVVHPPATVELTPSDLATLQGCLRYFHWTRILGQAEPGVNGADGQVGMRQGSAAHKILETLSEPSPEVLHERGLVDLQAFFQSDEWKTFSKMDVERELPFMMHIQASGRDCYIRGRMDAVAFTDPPRIVDYKYALWRAGAEVDYEIQMATYCLATMKSLGVDRAVGELWYLKTPLKIIRREFNRADAEAHISVLLDRYFESLSGGVWPMADRAYCDAVACGFRGQCWA